MPTPITTLALGPEWLDPEWLISTFGLLGILAIVFAESGLFFGFFLPGDSLLFTAGLLTADGKYITHPLWLVCLLITIAAIAGDQVGYLFGRKVGPALFRRPELPLLQAGARRSRRTTSSRSTAPAPSCWPGSCRSCGPSRRSWPA